MRQLLKQFTITDAFIGRYAQLVRNVVIPYQEKALRDDIPGIEKSHAIANFHQAAQMLETGHSDGEFYGMVFQDSDVAKWLEAAAYSLLMVKDEQLEARCDALIDLIGRAQHADGYLNTYFTVKQPGRRFQNLADAHELYCAGHMMEAAVAYKQCTGKRKLLDIMSKAADQLYEYFIVQENQGYPGHPEVELALMRLFFETGNERYQALAKHFVDVRGVDADYFKKEMERLDWFVWGNQKHAVDNEYAQNHMPVRMMDKAVGHAVRAVYLYTGMALVAAQTGDTALLDACRRLFNNITQKQMYLTGAIGSCYEGEAFTKDYHLPNDTAYAETCAAIGLMFFAKAMLAAEKNGKYGDAMERALYNCVLAGMELNGQRFFYVNPLEVYPGLSGEVKPLHHALPQRPGWFGCACCPPNVARLILSVGEYAWSVSTGTVYSNLFIGGELDLTEQFGGKIRLETNYPYEGTVTYTFAPGGKSMRLTLAMRLPEWSEETYVCLNSNKADVRIVDGFAYLEGDFTQSDTVTLHLNMRPKRVFANMEVAADNGRAAFMRGPLVYCAEGIDNGNEVVNLCVKKDGEVKVGGFEKDVLSGCVMMQAEGYRIAKSEALYSNKRPEAAPVSLTLIPYYAWGNRGLTAMRVWIPEMA